MPASTPGPKHNTHALAVNKSRPKTSDEYLHMAFGGFVGRALRGLGRTYMNLPSSKALGRLGGTVYDKVAGAGPEAKKPAPRPLTTSSQTKNPAAKKPSGQVARNAQTVAGVVADSRNP